MFISVTLAMPANSPSYPVIQGRTVDTENRSVPYTSITLTRSDLTLLSDKYGYFACMVPLMDEDTLLVSRIGYKDKRVAVDQISGNWTIEMEPTLIKFPDVQVDGRSNTTRSLVFPLLQKYSRHGNNSSISHSDVVSRVPGLSLKTYGGPAGIATLSVDGGPSSQTLVYLDGINLTSPQNGETDLSQLPVSYIKNVHYIPADISQSTTGSSDGILSLESAVVGNQVSLSFGSYGHRSGDLSLSKKFGNFLSNIQFGQRYDEGNYPIVWQKEEFSRENNAFGQKYASLAFLHVLNSKLFWKLTAIESRQIRGAAGVVWSPDTLSNRKDKLRLLGLKIGLNRPNGMTVLNLSSRYSFENYKNPFLNINSDHELYSLDASLQDRNRFSSHFQLTTELNLREDKISSTNTGEHRQVTWVIAMTPIIEYAKMRIAPSLKHFASPTRFSKTTGELQFQYGLDIGIFRQFAFTYHEIFRYPSFNDLYWLPGGNPDLEPEKTQVRTAQILAHFRQVGNITSQWQLKTSANLIQWIPDQAFWTPQNIQSARRQSLKISWQSDWMKKDLSLYANAALIETKDIKADKALRYAPDQTAAMGLNWSPGQVTFDLNYRYLGERISAYDFPNDNVLPGVSTWSLSSSYNFPYRSSTATLSLSIDNLTDLMYESIRGYPEPGRTFTFNTKINW
jgi:iron complex outermembrane receptor protein